MIFKYELGFVSFTWANLCLLDLPLLFIVLLGRNFVSASVRTKNLKTFKSYFLFCLKTSFFPALVGMTLTSRLCLSLLFSNALL